MDALQFEGGDGVSRAFHKIFDMTVRDYILSVRLKNAFDMLSDTVSSIRKIAEECGFHSANYFSKVFLAKVGGILLQRPGENLRTFICPVIEFRGGQCYILHGSGGRLK